MKRFFALAALVLGAAFCLGLPITPSMAATPKAQENILISLPESVLVKAIAAATPFSFNAASEMVHGTITVRGIHSLRLGDNQLQARLDLAGSNLEVAANLGGQRLRMQVGNVALTANVLADLRFDGKRQILYVKPVLDPAEKASGNDDAGNSLIMLLNGREFPIDMQDIKPFAAEVGGKTITLTTTVVDVRAAPKKLELLLTPEISSRTRK